MYWLTGILGLGLLAAPFILGYWENIYAMWTSVMLGAGVVIVSFLEGMASDKEQWEYWVAIVAGVVAVAAPFVLGFGTIATAMWTSVGIGLLLAIVAGSKLFYGRGRLS